MTMPADPFADLQAEAIGMMREMAHAAWVIVTRADHLYSDGGPDVASTPLVDHLPPELHAAYNDLRFRLLDLSELDGWAQAIVPLDQVEGYSKNYLFDQDAD